MRSWLFTLNFFFLQWGFVRLGQVCSEGPPSKVLGYCWVGPVWPLTGWWGRYVFVLRPHGSFQTLPWWGALLILSSVFTPVCTIMLCVLGVWP